MSSSPGDGHEGGNNEDVEADELARTSEARIEDEGEELEEDADYGQFEDATEDMVEDMANEEVLPEAEVNVNDSPIP